MSKVLVINDVSKRIGKREVIKSVSLSVSDGEIFGFVGENGSGKTTIIRMIVGLIKPDRGTISIMGMDIQNAEKTKNELITAVSHDIRTPLTSIIGYLDLIVDGKYKNNDELQSYSKIAYNKSKKLMNLVEELFEYTKLNNKDIRLEMKDTNLVELIMQLLEEYVPILEQAGMTYRLSVPNDKIPVYVDCDKMVRVFENLIANAVCYGKDGKYLDITVKPENQHVVIGFTNYGEPISPDDLPYIFEKFYRVEKSCPGKPEGTGLGLAIVKTLVELHNGNISVKSQKDSTIFEVRLPINKNTTAENLYSVF